MSRKSTVLSLASLPFFISMEVGADVYKYIDSMGHVFYTDNPKHSGYQLILKTPEPFSVAPKNPLGFDRWRMGARGGERNRRQYAPLIDSVASKYNLDADLLHAVVRAESAYNPEALSHKGAVGLMQLMPATAARYGVTNPYDPAENVEGGARYLSDLIAMFQENIKLAVAAYNAGEKNVIKYGNQIPPFAETQEYVGRVLQYYNNRRM
jgi:soluble lytic murein transglycosylase-like protein